MNRLVIKAIKASQKEGDVFIVYLPSGAWRVGGSVVTGPAEVQLGSVDDIRMLYRREVVCRYENHEGEKLSEEEYRETLTGLRNKANNPSAVPLEWDDVEDQVRWVRFKAAWQPVTRTTVTESDPIPVEVREVKIDTGSEFISAPRTVGRVRASSLVYTYRREAAIRSFAINCLKGLGFAPACCKPDADSKAFHESPANLKLFYVFGYYPFYNLDFKDVHGGIGDLTATMERDRERVTEIILSRHAIINLDSVSASRILRGVIDDISDCAVLLRDMSPKAASRNSHKRALKLASELVTRIEKALANCGGAGLPPDAQ